MEKQFTLARREEGHVILLFCIMVQKPGWPKYVGIPDWLVSHMWGRGQNTSSHLLATSLACDDQVFFTNVTTITMGAHSFILCVCVKLL